MSTRYEYRYYKTGRWTWIGWAFVQPEIESLLAFTERGIRRKIARRIIRKRRWDQMVDRTMIERNHNIGARRTVGLDAPSSSATDTRP